MKTKPSPTEIGIGAIDELSLRVSVAALVRVTFEHPADGKPMLALERKATLLEEDLHAVRVMAQPFGGALRFHTPKPLQDQIGGFQFDSKESQAEQDFRILIRPADWDVVRAFCLEQLNQPRDSALETDPVRELAEEFSEALQIDLQREQYMLRAAGTVIEGQPSPTDSLRARGYLTSRIYRLFEAHILDSGLATRMIETSTRRTDEQLRQHARQDFQNGGLGRANAVLALPLDEVHAAYLETAYEQRDQPILFQDHSLDETVAALFEDVFVSKFQRL